MQKYICTNCGYVYVPENGDEPQGVHAGTSFDDLPDHWRCPLCYVGKNQFDPYDD